MPFARTTSSVGYVAFSTREIEATYFNLKSLILTNWGERPNHYYLGCNLLEFLFLPTTEETTDAIKSRITSQVESWLPYVQLNSITTSFSGPDGHTINIRVDFGLKGHPDLNSTLDVAMQPQ